MEEIIKKLIELVMFNRANKFWDNQEATKVIMILESALNKETCKKD